MKGDIRRVSEETQIAAETQEGRGDKKRSQET